MYRASRAVSLASKTGEALPRVDFLRDIYEGGNEIYRGELVMIAGQPGAYKSLMALNLVHKMNVPTLYVSADSDAATQLSRLNSMTTGVSAYSTRQRLKDPTHQAHVADVLSASKVQWCFDSNPDTFDIEDELSAWVELYDSYPEVIVVDNLRNVYTGSESEHAGYKMVQQQLIDITRSTGACVITLHHMKLSEKRPSTNPAPSSGVDGMITQLPGLVLSIACDGDESRVCVIKDREGPSHPEAEEEHWTRLRIDFGNDTFYAKDSVDRIARNMEKEWNPATSWKDA